MAIHHLVFTVITSFCCFQHHNMFERPMILSLEVMIQCVFGIGSREQRIQMVLAQSLWLAYLWHTREAQQQEERFLLQ
jgi:hypothetical protein